MPCNHFLVEGFGGMGDAVVCCQCGLDKYPESIPAQYALAKLQGRLIKEDHPSYREYAGKARNARAARNNQCSPTSQLPKA